MATDFLWGDNNNCRQASAAVHVAGARTKNAPSAGAIQGSQLGNQCLSACRQTPRRIYIAAPGDNDVLWAGRGGLCCRDNSDARMFYAHLDTAGP